MAVPVRGRGVGRTGLALLQGKGWHLGPVAQEPERLATAVLGHQPRAQSGAQRQFELTETGFSSLAAAVARADTLRSAQIVRVGVESAGHYHRTLVSRLRVGGFEVVELNPAAVKETRSQQLLRRLN